MSAIFVYGTLKRGGSNHAYLAGQGFVGEARTVPGFRLFNLGDYPGMVPSATDQEGVTGEVWEIDPTCLAQLDLLEGVAEKLYERKLISLLPPFAAQPVETYLYLPSVAGRPEVGPVWKE